MTRTSSTFLTIGAGALAGAAGPLPWIAGSFTVVQPGLAKWLLGAAVVAGTAAVLAAAVCRQGHPAARIAVLLTGLLAAASSPAFVALLARQAPAEPRLVGVAPTVAATTTDQLRVLQLNAFHGYPDPEGRLVVREHGSDRLRRAEHLATEVSRLQPDVVVLQEAWCGVHEGCLADYLAGKLGFHAVYARANGSLRWLGFEEGSAILSRFPIADPRVWPLGPDRDAFERRIALTARIDHPGLPFELVGVHLANGDTDLAGAQAAGLLQRLGGPERPVLVAGDLNLPSDHTVLTRFQEAGYRDLVVGGIDHVLLDATNSGWWPLWTEWAETDAISDHPGILVEFQLPVPPADHDWHGDWKLATADQVGLDAGRLEQAVQDIGELEGVHGLLIARRGRLVVERYFRGSAGNRPHNLKSASKSVLSALAGLAIEQGLLNLDQPIVDFLPEAAGLDDTGKGAITVRHLLTMTSGLESTSFGNYGSWVASRNWVRAALARPLQAEPGTRFSYSTGGTHLLSATLSRAAGRSTHDFAREHLFAPLGIRRSAWARDRQGVHMGGNNLSLLPRDMLKFGQLYLNRGRWNGRQLLPWQWVDESTRPGLVGPRGRGRIYGGYGYLWWLRGHRERGAYIASGYGGQYIYVAPAESLVVVVISTEISKGRGWRGELFGMIRESVAGSVIDRYERRSPL
ncbi:MAG: serine hydrolase [Holophagales bacterium]|nr:serine hydrolase [Holophagales bacterium]MYG29788.1 serine hydrolase [Holophagales bacterium]MYI79202.1 serine hydrolase [Holophagales bacterium]